MDCTCRSPLDLSSLPSPWEEHAHLGSHTGGRQQPYLLAWLHVADMPVYPTVVHEQHGWMVVDAGKGDPGIAQAHCTQALPACPTSFLGNPPRFLHLPPFDTLCYPKAHTMLWEENPPCPMWASDFLPSFKHYYLHLHDFGFFFPRAALLVGQRFLQTAFMTFFFPF